MEYRLRTYLNSCTLIFGLHVNIVDTYSNDVMVIYTYIESMVVVSSENCTCQHQEGGSDNEYYNKLTCKVSSCCRETKVVASGKINV